MFELTRGVLADPAFASDATGSQLYLSLYGRTLMEEFVGHRDHGLPMTANSLIRWMCCAKPLVLIALYQVLSERGLDTQTPVAEIVPEFGARGKQHVTLADLMTHTVPYRSFGLAWDGKLEDRGEGALFRASLAEAVAMICDSELDGEPGTEVRYTSVTSWFVLAEVLGRLDGTEYEESVRNRVLAPLKMTRTVLAVEPASADAAELAPLRHVEDGEPPDVIEFDRSEWYEARWPGIGARGPAREMARPIECVAGWAAPELLDGASRAKLIKPCRRGLPDPVFRGAEIEWSLGLCVDPVPYAAPMDAPVTGQTGVRSSLVFADLRRGLVVSFLSNGMVIRPQDWARKRKLVRAIYTDLDVIGI